jgi:catechol 2,3-dioxygenase-like lactoylglutathione lyase family enzyme
MTARMTEISIDCADPDRLATFWCGVLGYEVLDSEDGLVEIGPPDRSDAELLDAVRRGPVPPTIFLCRVPEAKAGKNRLHFDVSPVDGTQADEVARIEALGARPADIGQTGEESWVVLADPEGNEFCVLRSLAPGEFAL